MASSIIKQLEATMASASSPLTKKEISAIVSRLNLLLSKSNTKIDKTSVGNLQRCILNLWKSLLDYAGQDEDCIELFRTCNSTILSLAERFSLYNYLVKKSSKSLKLLIEFYSLCESVKELFAVYNIWLSRCDPGYIKKFCEKHQVPCCNLYNLLNTSNVHLQFVVMECIWRLHQYSNSLIVSIPQHLRAYFMEIDEKFLHEGLRRFIVMRNIDSTDVYSLKCDKIGCNGYVVDGVFESDKRLDVWVDFDLRLKRILIICDKNSIESGQPNPWNSWEAISFFSKDLERVNYRRDLLDYHKFTLKFDILESKTNLFPSTKVFPNFLSFIVIAKVYDLKQSSHLHSNIMPKMFGQFTNTQKIGQAVDINCLEESNANIPRSSSHKKVSRFVDNDQWDDPDGNIENQQSGPFISTMKTSVLISDNPAEFLAVPGCITPLSFNTKVVRENSPEDMDLTLLTNCDQHPKVVDKKCRDVISGESSNSSLLVYNKQKLTREADVVIDLTNKDTPEYVENSTRMSHEKVLEWLEHSQHSSEQFIPAMENFQDTTSQRHEKDEKEPSRSRISQGKVRSLKQTEQKTANVKVNQILTDKISANESHTDKEEETEKHDFQHSSEKVISINLTNQTFCQESSKISQTKRSPLQKIPKDIANLTLSEIPTSKTESETVTNQTLANEKVETDHHRESGDLQFNKEDNSEVPACKVVIGQMVEHRKKPDFEPSLQEVTMTNEDFETFFQSQNQEFLNVKEKAKSPLPTKSKRNAKCLKKTRKETANLKLTELPTSEIVTNQKDIFQSQNQESLNEKEKEKSHPRLMESKRKGKSLKKTRKEQTANLNVTEIPTSEIVPNQKDTIDEDDVGVDLELPQMLTADTMHEHDLQFDNEIEPIVKSSKDLTNIQAEAKHSKSLLFAPIAKRIPSVIHEESGSIEEPSQMKSYPLGSDQESILVEEQPVTDAEVGKPTLVDDYYEDDDDLPLSMWIKKRKSTPDGDDENNNQDELILHDFLEKPSSTPESKLKKKLPSLKMPAKNSFKDGVAEGMKKIFDMQTPETPELGKDVSNQNNPTTQSVIDILESNDDVLSKSVNNDKEHGQKRRKLYNPSDISYLSEMNCTSYVEVPSNFSDNTSNIITIKDRTGIKRKYNKEPAKIRKVERKNVFSEFDHKLFELYGNKRTTQNNNGLETNKEWLDNVHTYIERNRKTENYSLITQDSLDTTMHNGPMDKKKRTASPNSRALPSCPSGIKILEHILIKPCDQSVNDNEHQRNCPCAERVAQQLEALAQNLLAAKCVYSTPH